MKARSPGVTVNPEPTVPFAVLEASTAPRLLVEAASAAITDTAQSTRPILARPRQRPIVRPRSFRVELLDANRVGEIRGCISGSFGVGPVPWRHGLPVIRHGTGPTPKEPLMH